MRGSDSASAGLGPQGLALNNASAARIKLRSREVTTRKQVGDMESMFNEEPASMREAVDEAKS